MKLLGILLIAFSFAQCGSAKFTKNPPFTITDAKYQSWVGGMPGSSGTIVTIGYESKTDITFDSIYFANKTGSLQASNNNGKQSLIGTLNNTTSTEKKDLILHSDPTKEFKNEIPKVKKLPFELTEDEAVISYKEGKKTKYFKIDKVKKGKPIFRQ